MIVSAYAALLAIFYIWLSFHVIHGRMKYKISLNDGSNESMVRRIRAHGNFSEYTPLFLIMLGIAEYNGLYSLTIHILGCLFILARLMHAYQLLGIKGKSPHFAFRSGGMVVTFFTIGILAITLLIQFISH